MAVMRGTVATSLMDVPRARRKRSKAFHNVDCYVPTSARVFLVRCEMETKIRSLPAKQADQG